MTERAHLEGLIESVRSNRDVARWPAGCPLPAWANILADEVERLWADEPASSAGSIDAPRVVALRLDHVSPELPATIHHPRCSALALLRVEDCTCGGSLYPVSR